MPLTEAEELELLELEEAEAQASPEISKTETLGRSLAQGATAGFGDELSGALEKGIANITGSPAYKDISRDQLIAENRAANKAAEQANPKTALLGNVIGAIPGSIAAAAALPATATGAAIGGAALGGLSAAGAAEGDIMQRMDDAAIGATVGTVLPLGLSKAGSAVKSGLNAASEGIKSIARKLSTKAVGLKDLAGLDEKGLNKLGDMLLDEKITSKPGLFSQVRKRVDGALTQYGDRVKSMYAKLEQNVGIEDKMSKDDLLQKVQFDVSQDASTGSFPDAVISELEDILRAPKLSKVTEFGPRKILDVIQDLETEGQRFVKGVANPELENKRNAIIAAAKSLRGTLKELAAKYEPARVEEFNDALEAFAVLSRAGSAMKDASKQSFKSQGAPGLTADQVVRGVTAPFSESLGKTTGAAIANKASKALKWKGDGIQSLQDAAKRSGQAVNASIFVMMQQDPKFRKFMLEDDDRGEK